MKKIKFEKVFPITILIIMLILFVYLVNPKHNKNSYAYKELKVIEYGSNYYENFYYENVVMVKDNKEEYLKKIAKKGIYISVKNMNNVSDEVLLTDFSTCDINETLAHIIPVDPYGKNDYKIEAVLSCK